MTSYLILIVSNVVKVLEEEKKIPVISLLNLQKLHAKFINNSMFMHASWFGISRDLIIFAETPDYKNTTET